MNANIVQQKHIHSYLVITLQNVYQGSERTTQWHKKHYEIWNSFHVLGMQLFGFDLPYIQIQDRLHISDFTQSHNKKITYSFNEHTQLLHNFLSNPGVQGILYSIM